MLSSSALVLGALIPDLLRLFLVSEELANGSDQLLNGVAPYDLQHDVATSFTLITHTMAFNPYAMQVQVE